MINSVSIIFLLFFNIYVSRDLKNQNGKSDMFKERYCKSVIHDFNKMCISELNQGKKRKFLKDEEFYLFFFEVPTSEFDDLVKEIANPVQQKVKGKIDANKKTKINISVLNEPHISLEDLPYFISRGLKEAPDGNQKKENIDNKSRTNNDTNPNTTFKTQLKYNLPEIINENKLCLIFDKYFPDFDFFNVGNVCKEYLLSRRFNFRANSFEKIIEQSDKSEEKIIYRYILDESRKNFKCASLFEIFKQKKDDFFEKLNKSKNYILEDEQESLEELKNTYDKYIYYREFEKLSTKSWDLLRNCFSTTETSFVIVSLRKSIVNEFFKDFCDSTYFKLLNDDNFIGCNINVNSSDKIKNYSCGFFHVEYLKNNILFENGHLKNIWFEIKYTFGFIKNITKHLFNKISHQKNSMELNVDFEILHRTEDISHANHKNIAILSKIGAIPRYLIEFKDFNYSSSDTISEGTAKNLNLSYKFFKEMKEKWNEIPLLKIYTPYCYNLLKDDSLGDIRFKKSFGDERKKDSFFYSFHSSDFFLFSFITLFRNSLKNELKNIKNILKCEKTKHFELLDLKSESPEQKYTSFKYAAFNFKSLNSNGTEFLIEKKYVRVVFTDIFFRYEDIDKNINTFCFMKHQIYESISFDEIFFLIEEIFGSILEKYYNTTQSDNKPNEISVSKSKYEVSYDDWWSTIKDLDKQKRYKMVYLESIFVVNFVELVLSKLKTMNEEILIDFENVKKNNSEKIKKIEKNKKEIMRRCISIFNLRINENKSEKTCELHIHLLNDAEKNKDPIRNYVNEPIEKLFERCFDIMCEDKINK